MNKQNDYSERKEEMTLNEKHNGGFSLVEVLLAMLILSAIVIPVCSSILLSVHVNTRANDVLQARVEVSSAVETLMAQGIPWDYQGEDLLGEEFAETGICVQIVKPAGTEALADGEAEEPEEEAKPAYFEVTVSDSKEDPLVTVTTKIRAVEPPEETVPEESTAPTEQGGGQ